MSDRAVTACDQCGQSDDHPKAHFSTRTVHHDCMSVEEERLARTSAQARGAGPKLSAIIDACKGGKKGETLLKMISDPKALPQAEGVAHASAPTLEEARA